VTESVDPAFEHLLEYIRDSRGFDYTSYKRPSLMRRVQKRLDAVGAESFGAYEALLAGDGAEFAHLFNTILINVTGFFRDSEAWDYLGREVIPLLLEKRSGASPIRVWSAGCATGEEAYTVAIQLAEALGEEDFRQRVKI
jgi:two-component system, chemotaxis family, CheB/CheR fusion protein